jgi:hypothetical protein
MWMSVAAAVASSRASQEEAVRVIDCDCGTTLSAANDEDLFKALREHYDADHGDVEYSDEELREMITEQAYDASDA